MRCSTKRCNWLTTWERTCQQTRKRWRAVSPAGQTRPGQAGRGGTYYVYRNRADGQITRRLSVVDFSSSSSFRFIFFLIYFLAELIFFWGSFLLLMSIYCNRELYVYLYSWCATYCAITLYYKSPFEFERFVSSHLDVSLPLQTLRWALSNFVCFFFFFLTPCPSAEMAIIIFYRATRTT